MGGRKIDGKNYHFPLKTTAMEHNIFRHTHFNLRATGWGPQDS